MKNKIENKKINDLLLDVENPRLPEGICGDQEDILEYMIDMYEIEELVEAIGENGYFVGEPLIIIKSSKERGKYIVVEGNRRLSALKILNEPNKTNLKGLRRLAENATKKPKEVPCVEFQNRDEILAYLGLRHVKGVKSWSPIAKARYIKKIFDSIEENIPIEDKVKHTAQVIGSGNRTDYIKKNLLTLYIYEISKNRNFFDLKVDETNFLFSVFMSAISKYSIKKSIGIPKDFSLNFANEIQERELKIIVKVICEKRKGKSILGNLGEIDSLARIFDYPKAIKKLESTENMEEALRETDIAKKDFIINLNEAKNKLGDAQNNVQELNGIENLDVIKEHIKVIEKRVKTIKQELSTSHDIKFDN